MKINMRAYEKYIGPYPYYNTEEQKSFSKETNSDLAVMPTEIHYTSSFKVDKTNILITFSFNRKTGDGIRCEVSPWRTASAIKKYTREVTNEVSQFTMRMIDAFNKRGLMEM